MATLAQQKQNAEIRRDLARAKFDTLRLEQAYRALDSEHNKKKRHTPSIEFKGEDEEQLGSYNRLKAIAKSRDNRRNYGGARALETQLWLHVVGAGPKIVVHGETPEDEPAAEYTRWFNSTFSPRSDGRNGLHFGDQARILLATVIRDGDILAFFDSAGVIPGAEGTLWYWEADQIAPLAKAEWLKHQKAIRRAVDAKNARIELRQQHGLICDQWGRTLGYIVTADRLEYGRGELKYDEATILPAQHARLLSNPWRVNQKRGAGEMLSHDNTWQDLERFTEALIQRSIVQSYLALKVTKKDAIVEGRGRVTDSEDTDAVGTLEDSTTTEGATRYKNWERLSMNAIEYMDEGEDVEALSLSGDLPDAQNLINFLRCSGGWSVGLSAMYATGKADASYSASMAEANLTWAMFEWWRKWVERYFCDWVAAEAFAWAEGSNRVSTTGGAWRDNYSWHGWPRKRAINPAHEAAARKTDLETGSVDYSDIHGPYWPAKLSALGQQVQYARDKGLWIPMFAPPAAKPSNGGK